MLKYTISTNYYLKWNLKGLPDYSISQCGLLINTKKGKIVKKVLNGGNLGFWIKKEFYTLKQINSLCELIKSSDCPF